ncbi:MAG: RsmD family RNA methyltransferase [Alphaproteobacteria bacterium]|nr:RsmD family RNA methyltransferase [Alphaproteobacteria bacterium]
MRVISGLARGKKLLSPTTEKTQPTMDRAKETLFNMLESWRLNEGLGWAQISFADVFAGSGAIGIEAWSRGVKALVFIEKDKAALQILNQNLHAVGLKAVTAMDALNPPQGKPMRIIFMDAPYGKGLWALALKAFAQTGWIDDKTLIIIETDGQKPEPVPVGFCVTKERKAGRNLFLFLQQGDNNEV